jgi:hypothetical protein
MTLTDEEVEKLRENYCQDSIRRIHRFYATGEYDRVTYERMLKLFNTVVPEPTNLAEGQKVGEGSKIEVMGTVKKDSKGGSFIETEMDKVSVVDDDIEYMNPEVFIIEEVVDDITGIQNKLHEVITKVQKIEVNTSTDLDKHFSNMAKEHIKKMQQGICPMCSNKNPEVVHTKEKFSFKCTCGYEYEEKR